MARILTIHPPTTYEATTTQSIENGEAEMLMLEGHEQDQRRIRKSAVDFVGLWACGSLGSTYIHFCADLWNQRSVFLCMVLFIGAPVVQGIKFCGRIGRSACIA